MFEHPSERLLVYQIDSRFSDSGAADNAPLAMFLSVFVVSRKPFAPLKACLSSLRDGRQRQGNA